MITGTQRRAHPFARPGIRSIRAMMLVATLLASMIPALSDVSAQGDPTKPPVTDDVVAEPPDTTAPIELPEDPPEDGNPPELEDPVEEPGLTPTATVGPGRDPNIDPPRNLETKPDDPQVPAETETPDVTPVPTPSPPPGPGFEGTVRAQINICDPSTNLGADPTVLESTCTGYVPVSFELTATDQAALSLTYATDPSGTAVFAGMPLGEYVLSLFGLPQAKMVVYCQGAVDDQVTNPLAQYPVNGFGVTFELTLHETFDCAWYVHGDAPQDPAGNNQVSIQVKACPEGYPALRPVWDDMVEKCTEPAGKVAFSLSEPGGRGYDGGTKSTSGDEGDGQNTVGWKNVPNVSLMIEEDLPDGYRQPVVFCAIQAQDGDDPGEMRNYRPNGNGTLVLDAPGESHRILCTWFNIPQTNDADIAITARMCPPGYDVKAPGADPNLDCTEPAGGLVFTLADTGPATPDREFRTRAETGGVRFDELAAGGYTITQTVPDGIASVFISTCQGFNTGVAPQMPLNEGPSFTVNVPDSAHVECDWFNVPATGNGTPRGIAHPATFALHASDLSHMGKNYPTPDFALARIG